MMKLHDLPDKLCGVVIAAWKSDRSLAKSYDQVRRAEGAYTRLVAIRWARRAARHGRKKVR